MSRSTNKQAGRATTIAAGVFPELPDLAPRLSAVDEGTTNAALQRWWDIMQTRLVANQGAANQNIFRLTKEVDGVIATVETIAEINSTIQDYLEARYTINVTAGPVVTGMTLFSATGPDTEISYVAFQADRFTINTSSGNKQIFSATATEVKLGNLFTVDLANTKVYVGAGSYNSAGTYWYVDAVGGGRMSLGDKFTWDGSNLAINGSGTFSGSITASSGTIGGWTISSTTLSKNNAILDSAGQLSLGTSNDVVFLSATDATYRIWIGNATSGSAAFRVTKAGVMTATNGVFSGTITSTSGTIGGFTLSGSAFTGTNIAINASGGSGIIVGSSISDCVVTIFGGVLDGVRQFVGGTQMWALKTSGAGGQFVIDNSGGAQTIVLTGNSGDVSATTFTGSGASLTSISASNISSGTLSNSRLPSAISVTSLATANFEANVTTAVDVNGANFRVYNGGTQNARIDYTTGFYYVQGNQVIGARGTRGAATITEVVALLDAWQAWA